MFDRQTLLVLVALVSVCVGAEKVWDLADDLPEKKAEMASIYRHHFDLFNRDLVEATESTEPEVNFKLITEIRGKTDSWIDMIPSFSEGALKIFTSLPRALEGCGYSSYKVLARNYLATDGRSYGRGGLRRIDGIVHRFALEHARKCRSTYAEAFSNFQSSVDPKVLHHVNEMFKDLPEEELVHFAKKDYMADVDLITTGLTAININLANARRILEALESLIEDPEDRKLLYAQPDELNGGYIMSPKFIDNIYKKYIEKPCQAYLMKSKKVFASARIDAAIEDDHQNELLHPADEAFRKAWVNHRLCQYLTKMPPVQRFERVLSEREPKSV